MPLNTSAAPAPLHSLAAAATAAPVGMRRHGAQRPATRQRRSIDGAVVCGARPPCPRRRARQIHARSNPRHESLRRHVVQRPQVLQQPVLDDRSARRDAAHTLTHRHTTTHTQTHRHTDTDTQTHRHTHRHTQIHRHIHIHRHTHCLSSTQGTTHDASRRPYRANGDSRSAASCDFTYCSILVEFTHRWPAGAAAAGAPCAAARPASWRATPAADAGRPHTNANPHMHSRVPARTRGGGRGGNFPGTATGVAAFSVGDEAACARSFRSSRPRATHARATDLRSHPTPRPTPRTHGLRRGAAPRARLRILTSALLRLRRGQ